MAQRAFKTIQMYKLPREEGKKKKRQLVNMLCMLRLPLFQQAAGCCRRL